MNLPLQIITNLQGNKTLLRTDLDETYHSRHGAIAESEHVFIEKGLEYFHNTFGSDHIKILEVGFGTGLNAMLTWKAAARLNLHVDYESIEPFPLPFEWIEKLQFQESWTAEEQMQFQEIHACIWDAKHVLATGFQLTKHHTRLEEFTSDSEFDLIYFDAFAPEKQPELWSEKVFSKLYYLLRENGVLVTYSAKGEVRRMLARNGFMVERLPGPPMKRHMLRATKIKIQP